MKILQKVYHTIRQINLKKEGKKDEQLGKK